jgi:two-component system phosphate regulon sensor histidine kinase PhoR
MTDHRLVLRNLPIPLILIGLNRQVTLASTGARALWGDEVEGRHYTTLMRQPDFVQAVEACLAGGEAREVDLDWRQSTGDRFFHLAVAPVGGEVLVTVEERTATVLSDQMRRDFVANVSHELRTPLTAMSGFIETLIGPARDDTAARGRFLAIMQSEVARMVRLVRDLLELSRVEAQERQPPSEVHDMAALLRSVAQTLRPMAEEAGLSLVITGDDSAYPVAADRDQIVQVLTNLIENALKYGSPPGGAVTLSLGLVQLPIGPMVEIAVQDQGEGIDPHHVPRLTERFYRVDSHRSREMGGTGLGLAIVKHVVTRHRGRLRIESEKGRGSRFSVLLPKVAPGIRGDDSFSKG